MKWLFSPACLMHVVGEILLFDVDRRSPPTFWERVGASIAENPGAWITALVVISILLPRRRAQQSYPDVV